MSTQIEQTRNAIKSVIAFIAETPWDKSFSLQLEALLNAVDSPCELAVAGRVKAGKSSFINALLGADLAKTGTNETTATINFFKYGTPEDSSKPVRCVYTNGSEEWVSREFLDSLQDHTDEALQKAERIKHLEYFLPDPRLQKITLVDTPGFDAIVGEDGEGHEKVSDRYLLNKLRERHSKETEDISSSADAVIYLSGQVATATAQDILQEFHKASGGSSSAMNAIGVMAKIDMFDDVMIQRHELAKSAAEKLKKELNTIVPVSAGLHRGWDELTKEGRIEKMQEQLRTIPEKRFSNMMKTERAYLRGMLSGCSLSVDERKELKGNLPWRVFVVIARELYVHSVEKAKRNILEIAGMEPLNKLLEEHFFKRGRILRCNRIANQVLALLRELENNKLYYLKKQSANKGKFLKIVQSHPENKNDSNSTIAQLSDFINTQLPEPDAVEKLAEGLHREILTLEELLLQLGKTNKDFKALKLIEDSYVEFTGDEREELYQLFGKYDKCQSNNKPDIIAQRQMYWKKEYNWARSSNRKQVAQIAIEKYGNI